MSDRYKCKCVRDYMECEDAVKDTITGRLFATRFVNWYTDCGNTYFPCIRGLDQPKKN